ncbi:sialate O-acetylesterase-like [Haliotis rubra]|uniref:sialate O-acetylesterase-like n=1 Tax=Haliotis rubra TaxID=36100 RepID=UPI001EE62A53|nr:sialate O-acetylesterase-like [Haliotis rubra]
MERTAWLVLLIAISWVVPAAHTADGTGAVKPFSFASYYGDHMVLQKAPQRTTIWGYAAKEGETITLTISGNGQVTTTSFIGPILSTPVWSVQLPAIDAGGPYNITATSSEGSINLTDVLFGDVWICSGQSNMQFTLSMAFNATKEVAEAANYPNIRVFTVALGGSPVEEYDLLNISQPWSVPSAATIGGPDWSYFSGVCWLYGKYLSSHLKYPIGLIASSYGGTRVEAWSAPNVLKKCGVSEAKEVSSVNPNAASVLWNAMMRPFVNMTIYGALWYQGEANARSPTMNQYNCTFPAMIDDWRDRFHQASGGQTDPVFPFGFVQLAPWRDNDTITTGFTDIRWHQTADYGYVPNDRMKNTFMAVAMDLPDFTSPYTGVHPRDKEDVSMRLCTAGLAVAYNQSQFSVLDGPIPGLFIIYTEQRTMAIEFYKPLDIRSTTGFEVTCRNSSSPSTDASEWFPLPITSHDNTSVTLNYSQICLESENKVVSAIRYAGESHHVPLNSVQSTTARVAILRHRLSKLLLMIWQMLKL